MHFSICETKIVGLTRKRSDLFIRPCLSVRPAIRTLLTSFLGIGLLVLSNVWHIAR